MRVSKKIKNIRYHIISNTIQKYVNSPATKFVIVLIICVISTIIAERPLFMIIPFVQLICTYHMIVFEILLLIHIYKHYHGQWDWYNEITPQIYLGSIPMKDMNHMKEIMIKLNITHVISINEDYEIVGQTFYGVPISITEYKKNDISFELINSPDFLPPTFDKLEYGADLIQKYINDGCFSSSSSNGGKNNRNKIYIHCKSGIGRSASLVAAYLIKHGDAYVARYLHGVDSSSRSSNNNNSSSSSSSSSSSCNNNNNNNSSSSSNSISSRRTLLLSAEDAHSYLKRRRPQVFGHRSKQLSNLKSFQEYLSQKVKYDA